MVELNKMENMVNEFIKKIYDLDKFKKTLDKKLSEIDILIDNLIDYCIKKKIFYYIENKISYTHISQHFKINLVKFIKNLIDPTGNMINKYIINNNLNSININNWDNVSDINSIIFKNYKKINESFEKNVSFKDDNNSNNIINKNLLNIVEENDNQDLDNIKNLSLYIKILINQNKYLVEFVDKINKMCIIISDSNIKYKKSNPFD